MFCETLWCWTDEGGMATLWAAVITAIPAFIAPILAALISAIPAVFAVYFAWRVGQRQIEIASRQVDIAKRQTEVAQAAHELESQRVRAELYEKRSAVYGAARKFINTIMMTGTVPGRNPDHQLDAVIAQDFQEAMGAAGFLFDDNVDGLMGQIFSKSVEFYLEKTIIAPTLIGPNDVVTRPREIMQELRELQHKLTEAVRPYLTINGRGEVPQGSHD
jgi:hypothetical protein